jgi:peptidoglycan glycosyltransferase
VYGLSGIEASSRKFLLGHELQSKEEWLAVGAGLLDRETYAEGPALYTTLDLGLQRTAYELLGDQRGVVVVMDIKTGAVLTLVNKPDFDPNRLNSRLFEGRNPGAPLLNRALQGQYPPGSVWKVLVAAIALQNGFQGTLDTPADGFTTSSSNPKIRDHEYYAAQRNGGTWRGRGRIGLREALTHSSNVFFAQLGIQVGAEALKRAMEAGGMDRPLSLVDGESPTLTLSPARGGDLIQERPYDIAQFSIGQGKLLVSPLQVTMVCAAVANHGLYMAPRLQEQMPVQPLGRLCSPAHAETLKWLMYNVVQEGTGQGMQIEGVAVAGKTGTAQTGSGRESHSWFAGFAPVSEPRWAFCVLVEEGGYGSASALPIARDLLEIGIREGWLLP